MEEVAAGDLTVTCDWNNQITYIFLVTEPRGRVEFAVREYGTSMSVRCSRLRPKGRGTCTLQVRQERAVTTFNLIVDQNKKPEMLNFGSASEHCARAFLGKIFIQE
jgi:hypothetical protein